MHPTLTEDRRTLTALLGQVRAHAVEFLEDLDRRPVIPAHSPPPADPPPHEGIGLERALQDFVERWQPRFSASAGPRYLGFVTGGSTPAALAGDWLAATMDHNTVSSLDPAGQELERQTADWLRDLLELPPAHAGTFVSGATMSNTVGLALGRERIAERHGLRVSEDGLSALGPVRVLSGSAHSSIGKAMALLGLGRNHLVPVGTLPGREAVDPEALEQALSETDGPCIVVANAGTVNTGDFDDLHALARLRERHEFWLHVDGAFGAWAAVSPRLRDLVAGMGAADSVCVDLHKWLNVPYDSAVAFNRHPDLQARVFQQAATYLGPLGETPDLVHLAPESSRRLRALPTWFTLRAYGAQGHAAIVEDCVKHAAALAAAIEAMPALRLLAPPRLNVVCFTLAEEPTGERLAALAAQLSSEVFLTPTVYAGVPALRAAFANWRTGDADVARVVQALTGRV